MRERWAKPPQRNGSKRKVEGWDLDAQTVPWGRYEQDWNSIQKIKKLSRRLHDAHWAAVDHRVAKTENRFPLGQIPDSRGQKFRIIEIIIKFKKLRVIFTRKTFDSAARAGYEVHWRTQTGQNKFRWWYQIDTS